VFYQYWDWYLGFIVDGARVFGIYLGWCKPACIFTWLIYHDFRELKNHFHFGCCQSGIFGILSHPSGGASLMLSGTGKSSKSLLFFGLSGLNIT